MYFQIFLTGYYCPEGSAVQTPCPVGTANPNEGMGSVSDCKDCEIDHFNHLTGQTGCFACGGEAHQPFKGSSTCTCTGAGRDFQVSEFRKLVTPAPSSLIHPVNYIIVIKKVVLMCQDY